MTMNLALLIQNLPARLIHGSADIDITAITEDSREVRRGTLFIARQGERVDGKAFIPQAVSAGAAAVVADRVVQVPTDTAMVVSEDVPYVAAHMVERFMGKPSSRLKLIGITGTNGKTTTAHLVHQMLNRAGVRCGLIGTVHVDDGRDVTVSNLTTPPAAELSRWMRSMVDHGCAACVMEVSSHALQQERVAGLAFDVGVFTNLTGDHLDYHGTMDEYCAAKAKLFQMLPERGCAIVNDDDSSSYAMRSKSRAPVWGCSLVTANATCAAKIKLQTIAGVEAEFRGPWGVMDISLPLCGKHNVMNALEAAAVGHVVGLSAAQISQSLASCKAPPGRLEPVMTDGKPYSIFVDYAHTDDALDNVLSTLRPLVPQGGRLRVVFGCGGNRDPQKRPRMASVACRLADDIIITSDNPRKEDPEEIVRQVAQGVPASHQSSTTCIVDRRQAIFEAVSRCSAGDVLLIAGKGHEDYQIIGEQRRPFDDRLVAREALAQLHIRVAS
ncbi:MAG TPA: UDP-N-acetylmuramoyl-L-alanyl-D-glutamate--2,6-diaminopimelate ligase [Phycisphaerales bacterium]|nr:UDP-N-acetylmuramoyl-L-alanyl-D-glutamate--2,6-diaminopimelate ligase [Phycisphaerales bacterium]HRQ74625.1 UDP-N-acetylmuramoyl-L-alanyl-D-glutamate--2,6-diaminopimelate ligase [Phycisphaerales bacterium]